MTTSNLRENLKGLAGKFIDAVASWSRIAHVSSGEATLNAVDVKRGLQADQSYCVEPEKVRMAGKPWPGARWTWTITPSRTWPSRSTSRHRRSIGRDLRGPPGSRDLAGPCRRDGRHRASPAGRLLCTGRGQPVPARPREEIQAWLTAEDVSQEDAWYRRLQEWAMARFRQA